MEKSMMMKWTWHTLYGRKKLIYYFLSWVFKERMIIFYSIFVWLYIMGIWKWMALSLWLVVCCNVMRHKRQYLEKVKYIAMILVPLWALCWIWKGLIVFLIMARHMIWHMQLWMWMCLLLLGKFLVPYKFALSEFWGWLSWGHSKVQCGVKIVCAQGGECLIYFSYYMWCMYFLFFW
jgi:hypothetical protein